MQATATLSFYPACADHDDILVFDPKSADTDYWTQEPIGEKVMSFHANKSRTARLYGLRQQCDRDADQHCYCLSDFIAPRSRQQRDYIGLFAVTAGLGADEWAERYTGQKGK